MNIRKQLFIDNNLVVKQQRRKKALKKIYNECEKFINSNDYSLKSLETYLNNYSNIENIYIVDSNYNIKITFNLKSFLDPKLEQQKMIIKKPYNKITNPCSEIILNEATDISPNIFDRLDISEIDRNNIREEALREFERLTDEYINEHQNDYSRPY